MRHSSCYKISTLLLALSVLPACSSHWGRAEVKPALLKIYQMQSQSAVTVERIDGRQSTGQSPLLIAPGAHAIEFRLRSSAVPSSASCVKTLGFNQFKSEQIYTVGQGIWNDAPSLMLKSARGEILASADISDCAV